MKKGFFKRFAQCLFLIICGSAFAGDTQNNLMPNARFFLTPVTASDTDAFSAMGEIGPRNYRANATYARSINPCQRFKLSAEYLTQRLKYDFKSGDVKRWVNQVGVGGAYQYILNHPAFQSIDADLAYAHAFHRNLRSKHIFFHDQQARLKRRIAGSDSILSYLGTTIELWHCAFISVGANYDSVAYHRIFRQKTHAQGFGGSGHFTQQLGKSFHFGVDAEFRQPFHFYGATFDWRHYFSDWSLTCGLYGNYTNGRRHLPNVAAFGIQIGFAFGGKNIRCCHINPETAALRDCKTQQNCDLASWAVKPAIYLPVVLAIADPKVQTPSGPVSCSAPPTSIPIPNMVFSGGGPYSVDVSGFFSSQTPLTFSQTGLPAGSTIDPSTGVISGNRLGDNTTHTITVTATNACGSTSQTFTILYANIE